MRGNEGFNVTAAGRGVRPFRGLPTADPWRRGGFGHQALSTFSRSMRWGGSIAFGSRESFLGWFLLYTRSFDLILLPRLLLLMVTYAH